MRKNTELKKAILFRGSILCYQDCPVLREDLIEMLKTGIYASAVTNFQHWYFLAIQSFEHPEKLYEVMGEVAAHVKPTLEAHLKKNDSVKNGSSIPKAVQLPLSTSYRQW